MDAKQKKELMQILVLMVLINIAEDGTPSSEIYARMSDKLTLNQYQMLIDRLEGDELLVRRSHFITRGPKYEPMATGLKKVLNVV